ncbi:MAG: nucleotidyltransferase family protein [Pseudomonadota bacterium]
MKWQALILAGSRGPDDPVAAAAGVEYKALAPVAGKPMIDHVIEALSGCKAVGTIAVSGPAGLPLPSDVVLTPSEATPASSVLAAFEQLDAPLLITTADNPLLSAATVQAFLEGLEGGSADIAAAVSPKEIAERAGNPGRRTYLKFRDGPVSGCNLFAVRTQKGRGAIEFWRRLETQRKQPWRMALTIGPGILSRYLAGLLAIDQAADAIGRRAGCIAATASLSDPYAPHDVDRPEDLHFVEAVLTKRLSEANARSDPCE